MHRQTIPQPRPHGRSLVDFEPLSSAEKKLLLACRDGRVAEISSELPRRGTNANRLRASFLRFLALGGDEQLPIHERGVQLWGAWITGILDLDSTRVDFPIVLAGCRLERVEAFNASLNYLNLAGCRIMKGVAGDRLRCTADLFVTGTQITGEVSLAGATIGGSFDCSGSTFENRKAFALWLTGVSIGGDARLSDGFHAIGSVVLFSASIGCDLNCKNGRFERPGGNAIMADAARISGAIFLNGSFHSSGEVRMISASIGANLECIGGYFDNEGGDALTCDRLTVAGNVLMHWPFRATGTVRMMGARIGGNVEFDGACLKAKNTSLTCEAAIVDGSMFLRNRFVARGEVNLSVASISRNLECQDGAFLGRGDALVCSGANVSGRFVLQPRSLAGGLIFAEMRVAALSDASPALRAARGRMWLDGFIYEKFAGGAPTSGEERVAWLDSQFSEHLDEDFRPQPWEQAIKILHSMGHPGAARMVAIAKQDRLHKAGKVVYGGGWLHWLYGRLVGYGYEPHKVLRSIAAVWLSCGLAYWAASNPAWFGASHHIVAPAPTPPSSECLIARARARSGDPCPTPPANYRTFLPLVYSADVLLPVISLGYKDEWRLVEADEAGRPLVWGQLLRFLYWFEIVFGWASGLLLAGVVGGLLKRN